MKALRTISRIARIATTAKKFGFTQGHYYLSENEVGSLRELVGKEDAPEIVSAFEDEFSKNVGQGQAVSFASGRMAFYSLLKVIGVGAGDEVILPVFTCAVMATAILRVGAKPVFSDICPDTLGSDPGSIIKNITPRTKVIVAQHSFGIPCAIEEISRIGKEKGIFVLEDCAICLGSKFKGIKAGNFGDAAIFSTDHTKPLNTMIGGLLYTRDSGLSLKMREFARDIPGLSREHREGLFRRLTLERRFAAPEKFSRIVFSDYMRALFGKFSAPVFLDGDYSISGSPEYPYPAKIPVFLAKLGLLELKRWSRERMSRGKLLSLYLASAEKNGVSGMLPKAYFSDLVEIIPLRFVFLSADRKRQISEMPLIDTENIWFSAPLLCSANGPEDLGYVWGSCPVAEGACNSIINWPTSIPESGHEELIGLFGRSLAR